MFIRVLFAAGLLVLPVSAHAETYFEDNFDGEELSSDWVLENPDPETYLVESGTLTLLVPDHTAVKYGETPNTLVLNKPVPKGDWTMTVRLLLSPQTMGEQFIMGVKRDPKSGLYAMLSLETPNYAKTNTYVTVKKLSNGKKTQFYQSLYTISGRNIVNRSAAFTTNIASISLQLKKQKHNFTARMLLEPVSPNSDGAPDGKWRAAQKLTSLRAPGDKFVLMFGSWSSSYLPSDGEALIKVDSVKIEIP